MVETGWGPGAGSRPGPSALLMNVTINYVSGRVNAKVQKSYGRFAGLWTSVSRGRTVILGVHLVRCLIVGGRSGRPEWHNQVVWRNLEYRTDAQQ